MIPVEAVEAAALALSSRNGERFDVMARAALEAAVPYMLAGAWQAGKESGFRDAYTDEEEEEQNPYMLNNEGEK